MKRRLTVEDGQLKDSSGAVIGRLVSLTIDVDAPVGGRRRGGTIGGSGGGGSEVNQQPLSSDVAEEPTAERGVGRTIDPDVADVWAHWCEQRKPRRTDLESSQAKLIRRALNADFTVDELKRGINGLLKSDWHRENRKLHLSSLLATRPGGPTLGDQVESFIELAERSSTASGARNARSGGEGVSSDAVARAKGEVLRAWEMPDNTQAHEQAQAAVDVLRRHGIDVVPNPDGRPTFEVRR